MLLLSSDWFIGRSASVMIRVITLKSQLKTALFLYLRKLDINRHYQTVGLSLPMDEILFSLVVYCKRK